MNLSAFAKDPTKHSDRTEQLNEVNCDISEVIIRLQIMQDEINLRIDELKRTREIVREMKGSEERNV